MEDPSGAEKTKLLKDWEKGSVLGRWRARRADKAVERQIIQLEKDHLEPGEVAQELRGDGVPPSVIDETYRNRERNLVKEITL
jgi:hypothetical protein